MTDPNDDSPCWCSDLSCPGYPSRDWTPALIVAALVVCAIVVVLI